MNRTTRKIRGTVKGSRNSQENPGEKTPGKKAKGQKLCRTESDGYGSEWDKKQREYTKKMD